MSLAERPVYENSGISGIAQQAAEFLAEQPHVEILESTKLPREKGEMQTTLITGAVHIRGASGTFHSEIPEEITDPTDLLIFSGYLGVEEAYEPLRHALALNGRKSGTVETVRRLHGTERFNLINYVSPELLHCKIGGAVIKKVLEQSEAEKVDIVGHSEGGWVASNIAAHLPERIRQLHLVASAGVDGHDLIKMIPRVYNFGRHEFISSAVELCENFTVSTFLNELYYVFADPLRTGAEGIAVANCNILRQLEYLGERGVQRAILDYLEDELFIHDDMQRRGSDVVDIFKTIPDAGHLGPQTHPEETAKAIIESSAQLELIRQSQATAA